MAVDKAPDLSRLQYLHGTPKSLEEAILHGVDAHLEFCGCQESAHVAHFAEPYVSDHLAQKFGVEAMTAESGIGDLFIELFKKITLAKASPVGLAAETLHQEQTESGPAGIGVKRA